ncbi:MAG: MBL fold metallo-hydrolase [Candidatus Neomarinimicrobiota bacterium]|jgi:glyoxylase-like metal-dependent hydrolase (beta-lactamase superfamily II)|nr:MBL fold metallo-hydrolase [Candidatus Neomarinimicrobiota bacterium]|tara:strand:- start:540 stop:1382 length:843 start_codon:yes stop_codon:yes gene_type:complete
MKIGQYKLYSIETSEFGLDGGAMFGIIPKIMWEKKAPSDSLNRIKMVTRSLLLVSDSHKILIDTGNGSKWTKKYLELYNIDLSMYNIDSSLKKYGFTVDDITDVVCTHLHFDHAGGNTIYHENNLVPTFSNATYWIGEKNWNLANHPSQKDQGSFMECDWEVLAQNNMIMLVKDKFLPGLEIYFTEGHTDGLMHPVISDGNKTLFYGADIFPTAAHIPVPWVMSYDLRPAETIKEKDSLLKKMHDEEWILFFEHDPIYQACTIGVEGKHYCINKPVIISD